MAELVKDEEKAFRDLSAELAVLSHADLDDNAFYKQVLARICAAMGAEGGAVWLTKPDNQIALAAAHLVRKEIEILRKQATRDAVIDYVRNVCLKRGRMLVRPATPESAEAEPKEGELKNRNTSPFTWLLMPIEFGEKLQGVAVLFFQPSTRVREQHQALAILEKLGQHVYAHNFTRTRYRESQGAQRAVALLRFAKGLAGRLDLADLSLHLVNQSREMLGCERVSLMAHRRKGWEAIAISGNDSVDRTSNFVRALEELATDLDIDRPAPVDPHATEGAPMSAEGLTASLALLAESSRTRSLYYAVVRDSDDPAHAALPDKVKTDGPGDPLFLLMAESHEENFFSPPLEEETPEEGGGAAPEAKSKDALIRQTQSRNGVVEWIASTAAVHLLAARKYENDFVRRIGNWVEPFTRASARPRLRKIFSRTGIVLGVIIGICLFPIEEKVGGTCVLLPSAREVIVSETTGRVLEVAVREGDLVEPGQVLASFDTSLYETEIKVAAQRRLQAEAQMRQHQQEGDLTKFQIAALTAEQAQQTEIKFQQLLERSIFRAGIRGLVMTKDVHQQRGLVLQIGDVFCEIASLDAWDLQIEIDERDIGRFLNRMSQGEDLGIDYILNAKSEVHLRTEMGDDAILSEMAYSTDTGSVFFVTIPGVELPEVLLDKVRPGFSGTAKVRLGMRPAIVVVTRKFIHLLRMHWVI